MNKMKQFKIEWTLPEWVNSVSGQYFCDEAAQMIPFAEYKPLKKTGGLVACGGQTVIFADSEKDALDAMRNVIGKNCKLRVVV